MSSGKDLPLDEPTFRACQQALGSALAEAQKWGHDSELELKAKLVLLILRDAMAGEADAANLQRHALENYFGQSENKTRH